MKESLNNIAKFLSRYPSLKRFSKYAFQLGMFGLNYHRNRKLSKFDVEQITPEHGGFFGYYDKSPESPDGKYLIYHSFSADKNKNYVNIVLHNSESGNSEIIAQTCAYNLQIGSRLQWIDSENFIYNVFDEVKKVFTAQIYNILTKSISKFNQPVFDISGDKFLTVNFTNLTSVGSEYGYRCQAQQKDDSRAYIKTGSIKTRNSEEIVNLEMLKDSYPHVFENTSCHHFNHLMFSPGGEKFIFIFRWISDKGRKEFLFLYEFNSKKLTILNTEMTSHCCWTSDNTIFGFMNHLGVSGYYTLDLRTGKFDRIITNEVLGDGHPSSKNEMILTDSYPDNSRMQHLMIISRGKVLHVGSFFSPLIYNEKNRCDLHPRFNDGGNTIYFDSMHSGKRHLYRIKMKSNE